MSSPLATVLDAAVDVSPADRPRLRALERALHAESAPRLSGAPDAA
jgi:hypothetical protein